MELSIIVPTYNERENILSILKELHTLDIDSEIIVVDDDSPDGTADIAEKFAKKHKHIKILRRKERGLASAIFHGIKYSNSEIICVMDADLQHPPKLIPKMFQCIVNKNVDIVIASRFHKESKLENFNVFRKFLTKNAILIPRLFFPKIRNIEDPMSGFFMLKKHILKNVSLKLIGFKFLSELLVKAHYNKVYEIPYTFYKRKYGKNKMDFREYFRFLYLLSYLFWSTKEVIRVGKFIFVGMLGVIVNEGILWLLTDKLNFYYLFSAFFSIEASILSNFVLNEKWTFSDIKRPTGTVLLRLWKFNIFRFVGMFINLIILFLLVEFLNVHYLIANIFGIAVSIVWNYLTSIGFVWTISGKTLE